MARFVFVNWTGDAVCAGKTTPTCSFTLPNRNVTVTPNYRPRTVVNVVSNGSGTDLIVSTPAGIRCPTDCSEAFFDGVGRDFLGFTGEWGWESNNHNVVSGDTTTGTADGQFCSSGDTNWATTPQSSAPTVYAHTFNTPGIYNYLCAPTGARRWWQRSSSTPRSRAWVLDQARRPAQGPGCPRRAQAA